MSEKKSKNRRLAVQKLETRKVLATVSFLPVSQMVELVEDRLPEVNRVTINGHEDKIILKDEAGIKIKSGSGHHITRISATEVHVIGQGVQKIRLDLGAKGDRVVAGGSTVGTVMTLGAGDDKVVSGSKVNDVIYGGPGDDDIMGYGGDDVLMGEAGNDILRGFSGNNTLFGGPGDDDLAGGNGDDQIVGGLGNDKLHGRGGSDSLHGGAGHDVLRGGGGPDKMEGGAGHDVFFASLRGRDVDSWIDGGSGADVLYTSDLSRVDSRFKMNVEHSAPTFLDYYFATEGKRFRHRDWHQWTVLF